MTATALGSGTARSTYALRSFPETAETLTTRMSCVVASAVNVAST